MNSTRFVIAVLAVLLLAFGGLLPGADSPAAAEADNLPPALMPPAQMRPTPAADRLAPWPTVYPPAQADTGAQEYYQRCMVCHGDRGQGLTVEWREALDPADRNCWQSGCHNVRTVPGGFIFPKVVPPVIGAGTLNRFETAQDLFDFIQATMPFQAPGSLSDEIYWQLTAYLVRENGFYSGSQPLEAAAASIRLEPPPVPEWNLWWLVGVGVAVVAGAGWIVVRRNLSTG